MSKRPFPVLGFQIDVGRQLERLETLKKTIRGQSANGYNVCMLYLEDAYAFPRHPGLGRAHAYTPAEMQEVQQLCASEGMELIPVIPALGHAAYITRKPGYARFDEFPEQPCGSLNPCLEETYDLLSDLFADWCDHVPGRYLHVSLDESPSMGQWAQKQGQTVDHARMFADHANRLNKLAKACGRQLVMWSDMFYYLGEAIELVDKDIIQNDWYYYSFQKTPRVEVFNFAEIDSARRLKQAGLEVWGIPSTWPNMPFGNIEDRWQNTADWVRYGREVGIDGLVITDWENSTGFVATTDWLLRAFGRKLTQGGELRDQLASVMTEQTGVQDAAPIVESVIAAGTHNLTGRADRMVFFLPAEAMAIPGRRAICEQHVNALAAEDWSWMEKLDKATNPDLLEALSLSVRVMRLAWRQCAEIPAIHAGISELSEGDSTASLLAQLADLREAMESFGHTYMAYWNRVRFADDTCPIDRWLKQAVNDLTSWIEALQEGRLNDHPLVAKPLLLVSVECRHPALPVVIMNAEWSTGQTQETGRALINFASDYAVPDRTWTDFLCVTLEVESLPDKLSVASTNYGQFGVVEVAVLWQGQHHIYTRQECTGEYMKLEGDVVWLGPTGATPQDPTHRKTQDIATYSRS